MRRGQGASGRVGGRTDESIFSTSVAAAFSPYPCRCVFMRDTSAPPSQISMMMCSSRLRLSSNDSNSLTTFGWHSERWISISRRSSAMPISSIPSSRTVFIANFSPVDFFVTIVTAPQPPRPSSQLLDVSYAMYTPSVRWWCGASCATSEGFEWCTSLA